MSNEDSDEVTVWVQQLKEGSAEAANHIWEKYYAMLVRYADRKLGSLSRREADEEDVAQSAMHSLYQGIQTGRFPEFSSRDDLLRFLLTITARKIQKRVRRQLALKRGAGEVRGESVFLKAGEQNGGLHHFPGRVPTPEFAEMLTAECDDLLEQLNDVGLRRIAVLKLQGFTNAEIAERQNCAVRSVERKLKRIRNIWAETSPA